MSEQEQENKVKDGKEEDNSLTKEEELKLAKLELGSEHTIWLTTDFPNAKNEDVINFKFNAHQPTMMEDLKIAVKEEQILGDKTQDGYVTLAARMLATLDICISEIKFLDKGEWKKFNGTFLDLTNKIPKIQVFYKEVVFPTYNKFIDFLSELEMDFDDLKKSLAQAL